MQRPKTLAGISVANLTIGRIDPVRFVEEASAAGFGRVGMLLASATSQPLPTEARTVRLHPGDSMLPLADFLAMLPEATPLAVETPVAAEAGWTTQARLHEAARRTLAFMRAPGFSTIGKEPAP